LISTLHALGSPSGNGRELSAKADTIGQDVEEETVQKFQLLLSHAPLVEGF
jgi:hypothetical protein